MSVEAICWALNLAPGPADRGGQPSSTCKFVLVGLANHAGPNGTAAFPSVPCPPTEIHAKRRIGTAGRCVGSLGGAMQNTQVWARARQAA